MSEILRWSGADSGLAHDDVKEKAETKFVDDGSGVPIEVQRMMAATRVTPSNTDGTPSSNNPISRVTPLPITPKSPVIEPSLVKPTTLVNPEPTYPTNVAIPAPVVTKPVIPPEPRITIIPPDQGMLDIVALLLSCTSADELNSEKFDNIILGLPSETALKLAGLLPEDNMNLRENFLSILTQHPDTSVSDEALYLLYGPFELSSNNGTATIQKKAIMMALRAVDKQIHTYYRRK